MILWFRLVSVLAKSFGQFSVSVSVLEPKPKRWFWSYTSTYLIMFIILNVTVLPDPSSYLSRHEEIIHQNNNDEMAHETQSNSSTGSQYLQEVLGDALADALSKVSSGQIGLLLK